MPARPNAHPVLRRLFVAALLLFAILLVPFGIWRINLHYRVKSQLTAIQKAREPTSGAELNFYVPEVPPAENGGPALFGAFTNFYHVGFPANDDFNALIDVKPSDSWPPHVRAFAERYLQTNKQALAQIEAALNRFTEFQYPIDYSRGPDTPIRHLRYLKNRRPGPSRPHNVGSSKQKSCMDQFSSSTAQTRADP